MRSAEGRVGRLGQSGDLEIVRLPGRGVNRKTTRCCGCICPRCARCGGLPFRAHRRLIHARGRDFHEGGRLVHAGGMGCPPRSWGCPRSVYRTGVRFGWRALVWSGVELGSSAKLSGVCACGTDDVPGFGPRRNGPPRARNSSSIPGRHRRDRRTIAGPCRSLDRGFAGAARVWSAAGARRSAAVPAAHDVRGDRASDPVAGNGGAGEPAAGVPGWRTGVPGCAGVPGWSGGLGSAGEVAGRGGGVRAAGCRWSRSGCAGGVRATPTDSRRRGHPGRAR